MLLLSISVLVLFNTVEISHGFYHGGTDSDRHPMCPTSNNPCRLRVTMSDAHGLELETIATGICTCSPPFTCSEDWSTRGHVVSRRVVSTSHNMTLQMMFCRPVVPKAFCRPGNISLIVKGSMAMPQDIDSYNCRCRRRQPLVLKQRSIGLDNLIYHSYVCANQVDTCSRTESCMIMHQASTDYPCQCTNGFRCRIPDELWGTEMSYGFCRP